MNGITAQEVRESNRIIFTDVEKITLALTGENSYTKNELLDKIAENYFYCHPQSEKTQDSKNAVKGYAGKFIQSDFIPKSGDKYGKGQSLREQNRKYLSDMLLSPKKFEIHSINLLEDYYNKFVYRKDCKGCRCGGNADGGIDGYLTVTDNELGCADKIYIQVKQKKHANGDAKNARKNAYQRTIRQIRDFGGVLATKADALKGIFVTNINFTPDTPQFINEYNNLRNLLILIDGEKWLDLADKCGYSIANRECE